MGVISQFSIFHSTFYILNWMWDDYCWREWNESRWGMDIIWFQNSAPWLTSIPNWKWKSFFEIRFLSFWTRSRSPWVHGNEIWIHDFRAPDRPQQEHSAPNQLRNSTRREYFSSSKEYLEDFLRVLIWEWWRGRERKGGGNEEMCTLGIWEVGRFDFELVPYDGVRLLSSCRPSPLPPWSSLIQGRARKSKTKEDGAGIIIFIWNSTKLY